MASGDDKQEEEEFEDLPSEVEGDASEVSQLPAGRDLSRPHITESITWINIIIARLSILILSKTYPSVITTSPTLDMKGFWPLSFFLLKSNKEYVLTFKILAQVLLGLIFTKLAV
jgi:hypothetical protein